MIHATGQLSKNGVTDAHGPPSTKRQTDVQLCRSYATANANTKN